jgi:hypothetical protein
MTHRLAADNDSCRAFTRYDFSRLVPVFVQADEPRPRGRQAASCDLAEQQARAYFRAMGRDLTVA